MKIYKESVITRQFLLLLARYCRKYIQEDDTNDEK
jgi:hypothetical protein